MKKLVPIFLLILASCELVVDVDVPYDGDQIVVNGIQQPGSTWAIDLTRSNYILSPNEYSFSPVDIAEVVIENPDGTTETLSLASPGSGHFRGSGHPLPGQTYRVMVNPTGLDAVDAEMTMPDVVPIVNVEWDSTGVGPEPGVSYVSDVKFKLTFKDPAGENFYRVQVIQYLVHSYQTDINGQPVYDTIARPASMWALDPTISTEDNRTDRYKDVLFEGKTYTAEYVVQFRADPNVELLKIELRLINMSKEYFRYEETKELQRNVLGDPFAQPVPVYSNFDNGFGIFGGYSFDARNYDR